jgi:trans-aconitate methyltransferase
MTTASTEDHWNADLYKSKHNFVFEYGRGLIELLEIEPGDDVLDLGCGTGELTQELAARGAKAVGVDSSSAMIEQASAQFPDVHFEERNVYSLNYTEAFDAIFSNAMLHWVTDPDKAIAAMAQALRPSGQLVLEMGGLGNMGHAIESFESALEGTGLPSRSANNPWYFPSIADYTTRLETAGFCVSSAVLFERPTKLEGNEGLHNWYRMFASSFLSGLDSREQDSVIARAAELARETLCQDGQWYADYVRLRVTAKKG